MYKMAESIVTNEDCMLLMKRYPDQYFDIAIVDPPYGIGAGDIKFKNRTSKSKKEYFRDDGNFTSPLGAWGKSI